MKQRIIAYKKRIDSCLNGEIKVDDWQKLMDEHLIQVGFFQHERLIHLLVTLTFALLTVGTVLVEVVTGFMPLLILAGLLLVLLIPYIKHYYLLENKVQEMYEQYDEILKRINQSAENSKQ